MCLYLLHKLAHIQHLMAKECTKHIIIMQRNRCLQSQRKKKILRNSYLVTWMIIAVHRRTTHHTARANAVSIRRKDRSKNEKKRKKYYLALNENSILTALDRNLKRLSLLFVACGERNDATRIVGWVMNMLIVNVWLNPIDDCHMSRIEYASISFFVIQWRCSWC